MKKYTGIEVAMQRPRQEKKRKKTTKTKQNKIVV